MITKDRAPNKSMETRKKRVRFSQRDAIAHSARNGETGANSLRLFSSVSFSTSGSIFIGLLTGNQGRAYKPSKLLAGASLSVSLREARFGGNISGQRKDILSSSGWA